MRRTQEAADASARGDAEGDAWLDAVMKESMRLHPVIPLVLRTLQEPATIGGVDVPAGATVGPSIVVAHGDANYERAEVFDPTRFLGQNPPTNTWIPFGGGVRRCIGAGFALMEGAAVLREVFLAWNVAHRARRPPPGPQHHLGPRPGRAHPRHSPLASLGWTEGLQRARRRVGARTSTGSRGPGHTAIVLPVLTDQGLRRRAQGGHPASRDRVRAPCAAALARRWRGTPAPCRPASGWPLLLERLCHTTT